VTSMVNIFSSSSLSPANYDATLIGWSNQNSIPSNIEIGVDGIFFCESANARQNLIDNFGWSFVGDSQDPNCGRVFLNILLPSTDTLRLEVSLSDAVQQLKQRIEDETQIPVSDQKLFFGNLELENGRTL